MKTPGTEAALERLRHVQVGAALSIQNGVLKDELLTRTFGAERVLGALADTSGELLASGEVLFTRNVNLPLGELAGGISERPAHRGSDRRAGIRASAVADILSLEWSKFTVWLGLMSLAVTTRSASWRYLTDPDCAQVLVRLVREVSAVVRDRESPWSKAWRLCRCARSSRHQTRTRLQQSARPARDAVPGPQSSHFGASGPGSRPSARS